MDQNLKQRLVGTAVITCLAAIFIPMLFDDPIHDDGKFISELKLPDTPEVAASNIYMEDLPKDVDDIINLPASAATSPALDVTSSPNIRVTDIAPQVDTNHLRWVVQVGSFSQKDNAISVQNKIRKQGFPATITTVSTQNGKLYKVNAGPELNKTRAEKMKSTIDRLNNINTLLMVEK